jgi:polygalacturonase
MTTPPLPRLRLSRLVFAAALLALRAVAATSVADLMPAQPVIPDHKFNLKDFGAKGDNGATNNTEAFRKAIAAVTAAGGGTLDVPAGTFFTGAFDLPSSFNLHLEAGAVILFSPKFADYAIEGSNRYRPLIQIAEAHDVLISGSGVINGNGEAWWPEARRFKAVANAAKASGNTSPRPVMLSYRGCQRIRIEGITLTNSPVFNIVQNACSDVTCEGLTIQNPANSPNTDGIDPKACQRVLIAHCRIDTGDDCVALGGGSGPVEEDILVTDCTFLHGHGCSIGSGTSCGVRNMLVRRCTFDGTDTGVRFKSGRGRGGLVENVTYEDLTMKNVGVCIGISSYYQNTTIDVGGAADKSASVTPTTPQWRNLVIRHITATACRTRAGLISGLPEMPAENILIEHVTIEAPTGLQVAYTKGLTLRDVHITAQSGPDVITTDTVTGLTRSE